jgi:APA family basic amino acid/polyamine antiporter/amino acid efflux transporter
MAELKKGAGYWTILSLAIGSIMGTGVFFGAAIGSKYAGNMVILSWVVLSAIALYVSACFGELVSLFPKSGGVYEFGKQAYGRFFSFIIGWVAWLVGNVTVVLLTVAAVTYLLPGRGLDIVTIGICAFFIVALNLIAYRGIEASSITLVAFAVITVSVLLAFIARGAFFVNPSNFSPFLTHPFSAVFVALFFIVEGFFGWEAVTYLAEETRNPRRVIPAALMIATVAVALLGLLVYVTALGIVPWQQLSQSAAPLSDISRTLFGGFGSQAVSIGIYLTLLGSAAGGIITLPRLVLALARDHLFLGQFKVIHPKFNTPHKAIIFQTVVLLLILVIGFGNYKALLSILVPIGLMMYIFTLLSVTILRYKKPELERTFKVPFGKIGPVLVSVFFVVVILMWLKTEPAAIDLLKLSLSLMLFGLPLYLLVELYYDPKMITSINDLFAYLNLLTENFTLPRSVKRQIFELLGNVRGKTILEFGCSVGTLTLPLSKKVGPRGLVYATHFSKNNLKIAGRRFRVSQWESGEREFSRVKLIHDSEHMNRVHPDVGYADAVVSVGMLGYLQDTKKVLREMHKLLAPDGRICFVEYGDFFHIIPNVEWLAHNKTIEQLFRDAGFSVRVTRKKGLFWNYIFIYGAKLGMDAPFI